MKKMIFSIIAIVAISTASVANNVAVEQVKITAELAYESCNLRQ